MHLRAMPDAPASESDVVVEARGLRKRFGTFQAVRNIDFQIHRRECFGFLGPNGAGKTSTMRMVQAVSVPTAGYLGVLGMEPSRRGRSIRARIGVVPQDDNLDPALGVMENLVVYARYFGIATSVARAQAERQLAFVGLSDRAAAPIRELSGGMKRRLVIARALMNDPELLVLDEPTTGLDPQARHGVWQRLRELREGGMTMLLTTHYMDEAERLCDRLVIMDGGRFLAEGTPRELIERHVGHEVVELRVPAVDEGALLAPLDLTGIESERSGDERLFFCPRQSAAAEQLVARAVTADVPYLLRNATLEDVFLRLTGRELSQ
jgi:lipooligosaccharide transport system ATP-binding protein